MCMEFTQLDSRKTIIWLKNGQKTWIDIFPKKAYKWPTKTWKGAPHHLSSGEMHLKTTRRYHLPPVQMAMAGVGKGVEKREASRTGSGHANWCSLMEKRAEVPQTIKISRTVGFTTPNSWHLSEGNEITILRRFSYFHVHWSIIHSNQDMEIIQVSIDT